MIRHCSHAKNAPARDLASLAGEPSLFAASAAAKLERLQAGLAPLAGRYDAVVANPPYMGSSSLGRWMGSWVKKRYPEAYRDLCTAFIDRGFSLGAANGYSAMVTMQSWMFLGSFEKLRCRILGEHSVSSMAHLGTRAFGAIAGEVVSTAATVFANAKSEVEGAYFRLVDMGSEAEKREGLLQALADPDCGWFYRAGADTFRAIPGSPIAYWASGALSSSFSSYPHLKEIADPVEGIKTGDNDRHLRLWFEVSRNREHLVCDDSETKLWRKMCKGGEFRKWYGNNEYVCRWGLNGQELTSDRKACVSNRELLYAPAFNWTYISSGRFAARKAEHDSLYNNKGPACYSSSNLLNTLLGAMNSSYTQTVLDITSPTLDYKPGGVGNTPVPRFPISEVSNLVENCVMLSRSDWDAFEISWDFGHHPLI